MNKLCYRIVFNKTRGMCMVVQETARSRSKGPGMGVAGEAASNVMHVPALRRLALLVGVGLGGIALTSAAMAQIVADPHAPGQQRATVLNAANGVLQVNIQTPSGAGVSRNLYSQFDVPKSGAILNNSRTSVQSQLGGWVQGNPWLGTGTARVILSEVNSSNPSRLQGYIEVAGARAEAIIANPAGIVVDGGGFINVSRATLTTGSPVLEDGRVKGYAVQRGQIVIDGAGLDASKTDYTALIARSLQVNAGLWAQRLNIIAGVNEVVETEQAAVTQSGQAKDAAPAYAIDVARLGGMYANQIYLVGTEAGVGVHNAGAIGAAAGDLIVTAAGRLENSGVLSATRDVRVDASGIGSQGRVQAGETLILHAGSMSNAGLLASGREAQIAVQGAVDNSHGRIEAPRVDLSGASLRNAEGNIVQSGAQALAIDAVDVINTAGVLGRQSGPVADGKATSTGGDVSPNTTGGEPGQASATALDPAPSPSQAPPTLADGRLQVGTLDNTAGVIASSGAAVLRTGALDNHNGHALFDTLAVSGTTFANTGGVLTVLHDFDARVARFVNDQGKLQVAAAFTGMLGTFSNRQGLLQAAQIGVHATDLFDNSGGTIQATQDLALHSAGTILNAAGNVGTLSDTSTLSIAGAAIDNGDGRIVNAGSGATVVRANTIASHGLIGGNGNVDIAGHAVRNEVGGTLTAQGNLDLEADALFANAGRVDAGGRLQMLQDRAQLNNSGTLVARGAIDIRVGSVDNGAGTIATAAGTGSPVAVGAGGLANRAGTIVADGQAVLAIHGSVDNERGQILAGAGLSLDATGRIENRAGDIESAGSLLVHGIDIGNDAGRIAAVGPQAARIEADRAIDTNGSINANGPLTLRAQTLANGAAGTISARGDLDLIVGTAVENDGAAGHMVNSGLIAGNGRLNVSAVSLDNAGTIGAGAQAELAVTRQVDNSGTISAASGLTMHQASLDMRNSGTIVAGGAIDAAVATLDNANGRIATAQGAGGDVLIDVRSMGNRGGAIQSDHDLQVHSANAVDNAGGVLQAAGSVRASALGAMANDGGVIEALGTDATLSLHVGQLDNGNGRLTNVGSGATAIAVDGTLASRGAIAGNGSVVLDVNDLQNGADGSIVSGNTLHIDAAQDIGNHGQMANHGTIVSGGGATLAAARIDNDAGQIVTTTGSAGDIALRAGDVSNVGGNVVADGALTMVADGALDNRQGTARANRAIRIDAGGALANRDGTIEAAGGGSILSVRAAAIDNDGGRLTNVGIGVTEIAAAGDILNGGTLGGNGTVDVRAATVHNRAGGSIASGTALEVRVDERLDNAGRIDAGTTLNIGEATTQIVNKGEIAAAGDLALHGASIANDEGRIITQSGADVMLRSESTLSNRAGVIGADGSVIVQSRAGFDNTHGQVQTSGELRVNVDGTVTNVGGLLESVGAASTLTLRADAVDNTAGRIVNTGTGGTRIDSAAAIVNGGMIGGNGTLSLSAQDVANNAGGAISAGTALALAIGRQLENAGTIGSGADMRIDAVSGTLKNTGKVSAGASIDIAADAFANLGGQVATRDGSGAAITVAVASLDNTNGTVAADGLLHAAVTGAVVNDGGTVHGGSGVSLDVGAALANGRGVVEAASGTLAMQAASIDSSGRIVNAGTGATTIQATGAIVNSGTIAANGALALAAETWRNTDAATVGSGADLELAVRERLDNAGTIGSGGTLRFDQSTAALDNSGRIGAHGSVDILASSVTNRGGQLYSATDSAGAVTLRTHSLDNTNGTMSADGLLHVETGGVVANTGGLLHGGTGTLLAAGEDLRNGTGAVESATGSLFVEARSIDSAGRIVNAGTGQTSIVSATDVVNSGTIAGNGELRLSAQALQNTKSGAIGSGAAMDLALSHRLDNAGSIRSGTLLHVMQTDGSFSNAGTVEAGGTIEITARTIANQSGQIGTVAGSGAAVKVEADSLQNAGGTISADGMLGIDVTNAIANDDGTVHGGTGATLHAGGLLANGSGVIESAAGTLDIRAQSIASSGRIVDAGTGPMTVESGTDLINAGTIASNGALALTSGRLVNTASISAAGALDVSAATVGNAGGRLYTASGSGTGIRMNAVSIDNAGGTISADGFLHADVADGVGNDGGKLHGGAGAYLSAGGALLNGSGTIEAGKGALELQAASIESGGRIVNAGTEATTIGSATAIVNSGTIAGNGALTLSAQVMDNKGDGAIGSGGHLELAVHQRLDNAGTINSAGAIRFDQAAATLGNSGTIGAGGDIAVTAAAVNNTGGRVFTATGSGGAVEVQAGRLDSSGGAVSADGFLHIDLTADIVSDGGVLHGGSGLTLHAGGTVTNGSGTIESAAGALDIAGHAVDSGGRIVNAGTGLTRIESTTAIVNRGTIAGNGAVALSGESLQNTDGAAISSALGLELALTQRLDNAGTVSSGGELHVDQKAASVTNTGSITAAGAIDIAAASLVNRGGKLVTASGSGASVRLATGSLDNSGVVSADGLLEAAVAGDTVNSAGTLHGGTGTVLETGGILANSRGTVEAAKGVLQLQAASIANTAGRIVNAGDDATNIVSVADIDNGGTVAGNGTLAISARALNSTSAGAITSAGAMELAVRERLANAGTIGSGGSLHIDQAGAEIVNTGRIGASDAVGISAASIANLGGQLYTSADSGAGIQLYTGGFDNSGGTVSADGALRVQSRGSVTNDGVLHGGAGTALDVGGALHNGTGTIETSAEALDIRAGSIDSSGRIVNAGTGPVRVDSATSIVNSGTIAARGEMAFTAAALQNDTGGTIGTGSGAALELAVRDRMTNAGIISSGGELHIEQAAASLVNAGNIGAAGTLDIATKTIDNTGGRLYTASGSDGAITLRADSMRNVGGAVATDGLLAVAIAGNVVNDAGILHGGAGTVLDAGGTLANGSGTIEARSGMLDIQAQSIGNNGRIVNGGTGLTTIASQEALVNRGIIGGNGRLDLHAKALQNEGGEITSGGDVLLDVRQTLVNTGTVSSGGKLTFDHADASFANSGQFTASGAIQLTAGVVGNDGGRISTARGSGGDIVVSSSSLSNRNGSILADGNAILSSAGGVDNDRGLLQAGGSLVLTASGRIGNDGGAIETLGNWSTLRVEGNTIDNGSGRISNAGSGDTLLQSNVGIDNRGAIAGMGNLYLFGQRLSNASGSTLAAGNGLVLGVSLQFANYGKVNSAGSLTFEQAGATFTNGGEVFAGGNAIVHAGTINNDGGHLGTSTGSGGSLTLDSLQLSNQGGRIATDGDLQVNTHQVAGLGELFAGRDLALQMEGDFVQSGTQQVHANRNLALAVTGNIHNASTIAAAGTLALTGQDISNSAGAVIEGRNVVLNAHSGLSNAGEIDGENMLDIRAATIGNSGGIVGGNVTLTAGRLDNGGSSALIGATGTLSLGLSDVLNNVGGATLYSSGDMTIGGQCGCDVGAVNNISSTIEAGGDLTLKAGSLRNVRENVQIVQVKTVDETVDMTMPGWRKYGDNHEEFDKDAANYSPHEVYFVRPSDILDDQTYVTPDGNTIHRAVIRTHANDSAFYVASSGLRNAYGTQSRLTLSEETRVLYYTESAQVANPDQGGAPGNAIVHANTVTQWNSSIGFSNQYGNCTDDCIRLVTQPEYTDPRTTRIVDDAYSQRPVKEALEKSLVAHHAALEDQLAPGAGPSAQILAGGNMHLTVASTLQNRFADIKARGALVIDGTAAIDNVGATLYRTHTFDGTWKTYAGTDVQYQRPAISEAIGLVAGVIQGGQGVSIAGKTFRNIDVSAGTVGNIRDAVNVIGSGVAGAGGARSQLATTTGDARTAGVQAAAVHGADAKAGAHAEAGEGESGTFGDHASATAGVDGTVGTRAEAGAGLSGDRIMAGASLLRGASTVVAAGTGVSGHTAVHAVVGDTMESGSGGHLSRSVIDTDSGLGAALASSGNGSHFATVLAAAASGHANEATVAGVAMLGGTPNDVGVSGAAHGRGIVGDGRPGGGGAATSNAIHLGDERMTGNASAGQQASGGLGNVVEVNPGGLFLRNPDSNGSYLFETRPQFANQRQWISSDYLLRQLAFDPEATQKRLGDGFYEQRIVREQLAELTGHALYGGASDDSVYKELLTNAASVAREFGLRPGIALSAEQVSRLTSDIAWLETQTVMLPDGHTETVLVPKVYLAHVGQHALQPNGALVAGNDVAITTTDSIVNRGGMIDGGNGRTVLVAARDIVNQGGAIKGDAVALAAGRDVRNESLAVTQTYDFGKNGGSHTSLSNESTIAASGTLEILAGRDLSDVAGKISAGSANLTAGRDISFDTIKTGSTYRSQIDGYTEKDSAVTHQRSRIATAGDLKMAASGDLKLSGTQIAIGTAGQGSGQLLAGGAVTIASVTNEVDTSVRNDPHSKQYDKQVHENQSVVGADVSTSGSLTVGAGLLQTGALTVTGSSLTAGGALKLTASDSVSIVAAQERHLSDTAMSRSSHGLLKSKTTQQADYVTSTDVIGSALSGKSVEVTAGKDINVLGSGIAGDADVRLSANGSVNIAAATRTVTEQHHNQVKESGFLSGDGFGFSIGTRTTTTDQSRDATTQSGQSRSIVGAVRGNLDIVAGDAIKVGGSDLAAGSNMALDGRSVVVNAGQDDSKNAFKQTTVQNGLSFAVGGSIVNAIQTTQRMSSAAAQAKDARFKALAAAAAVMTANDTVDDLARNGPSVRISVTAGHSESESTHVTTASTHTGSALTAGGNVTISAAGGGTASNLDIIGSDVHGSGSVALLADNHINLLAAQDTDSQHSKSRSTSAALGLAANIGTSGVKAGVTASASASRGNVDGDGTTQINSHVIAGDQLTLASGADTNLRGAVATGRQVVADIKGNLNIESLQDTAKLDGKRQSASASGTLGAGAGTGLSASASASQVHNDFASVAEQSGIRAGEGGFQVQVAGRTDLKGGVISSSDRAIKDGRNSLVTGSLSYKDIQNHDKTEASGVSLGGNVAANQNGGTFSPGVAPGIGDVSGEQSSVTRSGISGGELKVADRPGDVVGLNRDVTTGKDTSQALVKGWNGANALDEVGAQMDITIAAMPRLAKEIGDYAENKVVELRKQGNPEEAAKWEEGGVYRVAAHAALGAMGGGLGAALGAAAAAEAAPTLMELESGARNKLEDASFSPTSASLLAKLLVGGSVTAVGSVVGGSVSASTALNADINNRQLHQREYDFAKKYAKLVAEKLGVAKEEAEGRIVAEILRNSDKATAIAAGDKHDYEIRALLGCQNLNCNGRLTDANFADHNFNREFIAPNLQAYHQGMEMIQKGMTDSDLIVSNVKKDPVGVTLAGTGLVGLGYISGGAGATVGVKMVGAGIGALANYVFQPSGQTDWIDVSLAGVTGFVTSGAGFISSGVTNVGGSIIGSGIKGENPDPGIYGAGVGTVGGYVVGKAIEIPLGRVFNSRNIFAPDWIDMGYGLSRWNSPSPIPGLVSGVGASFAQEPIGNKTKDFIQAKKDEIHAIYIGR